MASTALTNLPPVNAQDEARALVGLERGPGVVGTRLAEHLSCIHFGSVLTERVASEPGWSLGLVQCRDRWVLLLERFLEGTAQQQRRWRIVDAVVLPEAVGTEFDPQRPKGPYLYAPDTCSLDGKWGTRFYAVVRLSQRKTMDWRTGVQSAWGYDLKRERIVRLSPKRVVCRKAEYARS